MKLPEFIIKVKTLSADYKGNFQPEDELKEPFNKYTKGLSRKLKKNQGIEFDQLIQCIKILIKNHKILDLKIAVLEKEYHSIKVKLAKAIEEADYKKSFNAWLDEQGHKIELSVSSNLMLKSRKDALAFEIDYFRDLMNFSFKAKKYLIEELLVKVPIESIEHTQIPELVLTHMPKWWRDLHFKRRKKVKGVSNNAITKGRQSEDWKFEDLIKSKDKSFIVHLRITYKNSPPREIAALLYCLGKMQLLTHKLEHDQEKWTKAISAFFERQYKRESVRSALSKFKSPSVKNQKLITEIEVDLKKIGV